MALDKKFEDLFLKVSTSAAISSYNFVGKKDKILADKAAVDAMRSKLNKIGMDQKVPAHLADAWSNSFSIHAHIEQYDTNAQI